MTNWLMNLPAAQVQSAAIFYKFLGEIASITRLYTHKGHGYYPYSGQLMLYSVILLMHFEYLAVYFLQRTQKWRP